MALTINTNVMSLTAQRNLSKSQSALSTSMQRLSSGLRINSAKDDAAGLAISDRMTSQIRGLNQAIRNANDGISLAQVGEGAMGESTNLLQRMRELAVQSANASNSATDRASLQAEVNELKQEMSRIANNTNFNGLNILDGTFTNAAFQVGADANQTISVSISGVGTSDLGRYSVDGANDDESQGTGSTVLAASTLAGTNMIEAQILTVVGSSGSETVTITDAMTAEEVALAVNAKAGSTNVNATATNTAYLSDLTATGTLTLELGSGTGALTNISSTTGTLQGLTDAITASSGSTGITASYDGTKITLTQAEGKDIKIQNFSGSGTAVVTLKGSAETTGVELSKATTNDSSIASGTVEFYSTEDFSISSSVDAIAGSILDVTTGGTSQATTKETVASIDISSITGANDAISIVDAAISKIDSLRANLGALQRRFESTIANQTNVVENLSAARSRIVDADIAMETAEMTKANVLQQAGVAILAQANQLPQLALSLLGN